MAIGHTRKSALKKDNLVITRRTLLGFHEQETRQAAEDLRYELIRATEAIETTVSKLRKHYGIALPHFTMQWDPVHTSNPTPSNTLKAYAGDRSAVRVTILFAPLTDDTIATVLADFGISHLIGVEVDSDVNKPTWITDPSGSMLAKIKVRLDQVAWVLHDAFIDMSIVHARGQLWSGLRNNLSSTEVAAQKALFAKSIGQEKLEFVDIRTGSLYTPIASIARFSQEPTDIHLDKYIAYWTDFANQLSKSGLVSRAVTKEQIAENIRRHHINGGQISHQKLHHAIDLLTPGHYRLYFLARSSSQETKIAQIAHFFERNPNKFRTQWWIIRAKDDLQKLAHMLISEGFISYFPFYVGEMA